MANVLNNDEMVSYRELLESLRARLRGDLDQMTDEALGRDNAGATGNLSNLPFRRIFTLV